MTFARKLSLLVFFTSVLLSVTVRAQGIEIKGLRIGMTTGEVEKKIGRLPRSRLHDRGCRNKYPTFSPEFHEAILRSEFRQPSR